MRRPAAERREHPPFFFTFCALFKQLLCLFFGRRGMISQTTDGCNVSLTFYYSMETFLYYI